MTEFTAYITKYALTSGIIEAVGRTAHRVSDDMFVYQAPGTTYDSYAHGEGRDWHRTRDGALARAEVMRKNKLKSLQKSIDKLEKLRFT